MDTLNQVQTQTKWVSDPAHSELTFKVRHLMISNVKGEFTDFQVEMTSNGDDLTAAEVQVKINAGSVSTNNADRDNHLKAEDFFDVANHPELSFTSNAVQKVDDETYKVKGNLTIKGVSKEVVLDAEFGGYVTDPYGNEKAGFSISGKINRKEFGLNWNAALETGGVMVGDEVKLNAEVQLVKQS
ncbi:YceI family protein [Roseivirga sp. BDSF3-8]|uniref:YceI family protein n=1 Tax=Roseivirga sp. BDSF3-8 TaxID=3241598 RepID=UPI0035323FD0